MSSLYIKFMDVLLEGAEGLVIPFLGPLLFGWGGALFCRNCTVCLVSSRRRLVKSLTRASMSGSSTLVRASRIWICNWNAGEAMRSLRRSMASGAQLNLSKGDGVVCDGLGRGLWEGRSSSVMSRE